MLFNVIRGGRCWALLFLAGGLFTLAPVGCPAADSVTLNWDPSPDPAATGYNLYYGGTGTRIYTNMVPAGNALSATVTGLVAGVTYYFAATATDDTGLESDFSNEVEYSLPSVPPNQPPTLNALANVALNENAGVTTVNLAGISAGATNEIQPLSVTATSANPGLIPDPTVNYSSPGATGSISFAPVPFATGAATITVTVNDGGASNNIVTRSFLVTVSAVNQVPTLNPLADVTINANAGWQTVTLSGVTAGAGGETQSLTLTATSANPGLIPNPTVNYASPNTTGSLTFKPAANAHGTTAITVVVNDGGASNNVVTRSFTVAVNQPPALSGISNLTIPFSSQTAAIPFTVSDAESPAASLTVTGTSSNPALVQTGGIVFGGAGSGRTVTVTPVAGQSGSAYITITVGDGLATTSGTFQLAVKPPSPANLHITLR